MIPRGSGVRRAQAGPLLALSLILAALFIALMAHEEPDGARMSAVLTSVRSAFGGVETSTVPDLLGDVARRLRTAHPGVRQLGRHAGKGDEVVLSVPVDPDRDVRMQPRHWAAALHSVLAVLPDGARERLDLTVTLPAGLPHPIAADAAEELSVHPSLANWRVTADTRLDGSAMHLSLRLGAKY